MRLWADLVVAAALACSVLALLALDALHAATAWPPHEICQSLITLMWRLLSVSRALHMLSSCDSVLCLAPPAVDLLEALGRCVYETGLLLLFALCRTFADLVELLPRGWRALAFPR